MLTTLLNFWVENNCSDINSMKDKNAIPNYWYSKAWIDYIVCIPNSPKAFFKCTFNINKQGFVSINSVRHQSINELFSILESELDINLSYYVTPWRSNDQKVFVADTGKAYNDFLWKPIIDKITGIEKMIEWVDSNN